MRIDLNCQFSALYIHVPFCLTKCHYCDFYSQAGALTAEIQAAYLAALKNELAEFGANLSQIETIFFGGGTPSLLAPEIIQNFLIEVDKIRPLGQIWEITLEANPDDLSTEKLASYRKMGFNRLSLGVQSLNDNDLQFLGRRHNAAGAIKAILAARAAGFDNLSCDLITGLPGQTIRQQTERLEKLLAYQPQHISCYQLTIAPKTPLARAEQAGLFRQLPDSRQLALLKNCAKILNRAGYQHYEVSNYACDEAHQCRHNNIYWQHRPYLGLGPAAHSFNGRQRFWNQPLLAPYLAGQNSRKVENLTPNQLLLEKVSLAIRTAAGVPAGLVNSEKANLLINQGFLTLKGKNYIATPAGLGVADYLPLKLLDF